MDAACQALPDAQLTAAAESSCRSSMASLLAEAVPALHQVPACTIQFCSTLAVLSGITSCCCLSVVGAMTIARAMSLKIAERNAACILNTTSVNLSMSLQEQADVLNP